MESKIIVLPNGIKIWSNEEGQMHRDDGPAMIWPDGTKLWYQNDKRHRTDGPAVIFPTGTKQWYLNGKRHREDGPAEIWSDGTEEWFLNGKKLSFTEWADKLNLDHKQRLMMVMKWNPK